MERIKLFLEIASSILLVLAQALEPLFQSWVTPKAALDNRRHTSRHREKGVQVCIEVPLPVTTNHAVCGVGTIRLKRILHLSVKEQRVRKLLTSASPKM